MVWDIEAPQGNEAAKVKYDIVPFTRGRGLDLGCGPFKAFPHFIGVDNGHHAEEFGWKFKPDVSVNSCDDLSLFGDSSMDFVFSSHLLEHIDDHILALKEWMRVLKDGGYLILYLPHKLFYPNIGEYGANPDHKHDFMPQDIIDVMQSEVGYGWDLVLSEDRHEDNEYSFLQVYRKKATQDHTFSCKNKPKKTACVCRFGGFGDMLQAAALFPELKREGYHVTVMTTPKGYDIIREDPHVDGWIIQDQDQVPNAELHAYWKSQARRFDKFVQLSESVEGTLLAMPGRANHMWPASVRHALMNTNYLEFTFQLAEMEFHPDPHFYPTDEEVESVKRFILKNGLADKFVIMWALAGSSLHKFYPHMDNVIAQVMLGMPDAVIVTVGDEACQLLEQGWENEKRVISLSGSLGIRETLTLAQHMNCVVGPETGVLNAVAFEEIAKVIMLSHSSENNLTRDWKCTIPISAPYDAGVPICNNRPCHRLHYSNEFCPTHPEIGSAACATSIDPDRVFNAIKVSYETWKSDRTVQVAC